MRHARRMGAPGIGYFVAVKPSTGEIVGFVNFGPGRGTVPNDIHIHEIYALYIRAEYQGSGIGTALVRAAARHSAGRGARSLFAWVLAGNPNRRFYEKLGASAVEMAGIGLGNRTYDQVAYLWEDITLLSQP